jgi:hypothetical protein
MLIRENDTITVKDFWRAFFVWDATQISDDM